MPGDNLNTVKINFPSSLQRRFTFAIREGGRTVGSGQITEIVG